MWPGESTQVATGGETAPGVALSGASFPMGRIAAPRDGILATNSRVIVRVRL